MYRPLPSPTDVAAGPTSSSQQHQLQHLHALPLPLPLQHLQPHQSHAGFGSGPPPPALHQAPMASFFAVPDGGGGHASPPKQNRARRKSAPGSENVKHRRTRSGCYTCRTRRVKCDETHPVCERCQKGGRECTYPEVVPTAKSAGGASKKREKRTASREGSSSLDDVEEDVEGEYDDKPSPPEGASRPRPSASLSHLRGNGRRGSWQSSSDQSRRSKNKKSDMSPSPQDNYLESSAPTSPAESLRRTASHTSLVNSAEWAHLPHDVAFYLNYHRQVLTCHHYLLKNDNHNFFKTTLLEHAVNHDALLYAVAAFSSFHYSVNYETGVFQTFLEYYNKSVGLLRVSLDQNYTLDTVMTILQLASFEEYLGDWMNLMEHRNAASKILQHLWNPVTMAETPTLRMIYNWFSHFDVLAAMMAGHQTSVSSEWPKQSRLAVNKALQADPNNLSLMVDDALCGFRDLAVSVSIMTAKRAQNLMTMDELVSESSSLLAETEKWRANLNPSLFLEKEAIAVTTNPEHCPFKPARIYRGHRWPLNFLDCDYYSLLIMLKHQIAHTNNTGPEETLATYAIKICERLAAIEACPDAPPGSLLVAQAAIGLAALWIPKDQAYRRWVQNQLAKAEQMGFVYPLAFRNRMAQLWEDPQLKHTWISNDTETAIGVTIRQLVDMRDAESPKDSAMHDIKEMRTLMTEMRLDSKGSSTPPQSVPAEAPPGTEPENTPAVWR